MSDTKDLTQAGIDVSAGLHYTGTMEIYESLLADFFETVDPRCETLRQACESQDMTVCRRETHTLKSQARTVGANKLASLAQELETAAAGADCAFVRENLQALIDEYKRIGDAIAPYKKIPQSVGGRSAEDGVLKELCVRLLTALDDFDIDRAAELMRTFFDYDVAEIIANKRNELKDAVDNFYYERAMDLAREIISLLK